jgi:hypothetical protein
MTPETGNLPHPHPVDFPIFMTPLAGLLVGLKGMHFSAVAILTNELFHKHVTCVAY